MAAATCTPDCRCRCQQGTSGCREGNPTPRRVDTATPCRQCATPKRKYGTSVDLCPECDFARCPNPDCRQVVRALTWSVCPHCGARP